MAHVVLNSRTLRLRVFPKPKGKAARPKRESKTLALFDPPADESMDAPTDKLAEKVAALCLLNRLNAELCERLQTGGEAFVSNAVIGGKFALRACIVNFRTSEADVRALPATVVRAGRALHGEMQGQ